MRWTLVYSIFMTVGWGATSGRLIVGDSLSKLLEDPFDTLWMFLDLTARVGLLVALTFGMRRPWGHRLGAITLIATWLLGVLSFLMHRMSFLRPLEIAISAGLFLVMLLLVYQFIFGLPSRIYHELVSANRNLHG
ncbi:hypothetical protein [Brevifollis gellanilyticus]|uniref:hypothetical protein n=1 Tax=Brevifollis gellanilyticus TaxID=748831 RepID=UPI001C3F94CA|nr:hypothetical protein [Brevifollis gellanilyticus]